MRVEIFFLKKIIMKKDLIYSQYNGGINFLTQNIHKKLFIFVIDDQEVYLKLLIDCLSRNSKHTVWSFSTGEEALIYAGLNPDLVITDYHLNGVNPAAKNGSEIAAQFRKEVAGVEVVIISSDHKVSFLSGVNSLSDKLMFKDGYVLDRLSWHSKKMLSEKLNSRVFDKLVMVSLLVFVALFSLMVVTNS